MNPLTLLALLCSFHLHLPAQALIVAPHRYQRYRSVSFVHKLVPNGAKANRPIRNARKKWNRPLSAATDTEADEAVIENDDRKVPDTFMGIVVPRLMLNRTKDNREKEEGRETHLMTGNPPRDWPEESTLSPMEHVDSATAPLKLERAENDFVFVGDHSSMETENADDDFVFVGDKSSMERDPALRLVSSEVSIWNSVRKEAPPKSGLPLGILLERTWDTAEDIFMHLRRIPYEKGWSELTPKEEATRKTIVILGSGWAAHALMKVADCNKLRLIVVSPSNHFVFTPMLASAAVGTVEYRSMTEAVRAANPMISDYLEGTATAVDVASKTVTVKLNNLLHDLSDAEVEPPTLMLSYDHLVVSVGSRVDDRGVPGADRALRLKSTDDARRLRTAVGECFEYASRPDVSSPDAAKERSRRVTFLIVGGGPTGVELAGELHDLFQDVTRPHKGTYPKLAGSVRVILAHGGPNLVPQFEEVLRGEALNSLKKKGVEVILNARITEVGDGYARLSTKVFDPVTGRLTDRREDSVLPVGLTVWCAGTAPVPFVEDLLNQLAPEARNYDGRVKVDQWMRPPMKDPALLGSVLVLGDAASFEGLGGSGDAELPATAQVAGQQGAYVARLLDRGYDLCTTPPLLPCMNEDIRETCDVFYDPLLNSWLRFRGLDMAPKFGFLNLGMLAYLGGGEALSQVQLGDVPILAWAGSVAFVLWRSVYLVKQVATRNRILVTFDWIKSALFGRDVTRL